MIDRLIAANQGKDINFYIRILIKVGLALILFLPLVTDGSFYFPFIVPRNLIFRFILLIVLALYMYLFSKDKKFRLKFNKAFVIFCIFIFSLTISSFLGGNFPFSFWSNFERMDGLVNWYYLIIYVVVLMGTLRNREDWKQFFNISIVAAWLIAWYGLAQKLGWDKNLSFIMASSGDTRVASTFGNAAYVGSYMFMHIVVSLYLLIITIMKKQLISFKTFWYILSLMLFVATLVLTQTRGAFLGLAVFLFLLTIFYLWFNRKKINTWYYVVAAILISGILFVGLLFQQKDSSWVNNVLLFQKITDVSLSDTTVESRLAIWQGSFKGYLDKPILGWGEENFQYVFNKYFPVEIYHSVNSEVWFDRPHNILMQHLIHGGVIGFSLYLAVFIYLIYALVKKYKKDKQWFFSFFWVAFLLSFLLHDMFIFDSINTNVILYLILAFLFKVGVSDSYKYTNLPIKSKDYIRATVVAGLFVVLSVFMVWQPMKGNLLLMSSLKNMSSMKSVTSPEVEQANKEFFHQAVDDWTSSRDISFLGDKEKGEVLLRLFQSSTREQYISKEDQMVMFQLTKEYLEETANRYPNDTRHSMFLSYFYNIMSGSGAEFANANVELLERISAWASQRPDILTQLSHAYLVVGRVDDAKEVALRAKELVPEAKFAYWNLLNIYVVTNDVENIKLTLEKIFMINIKQNNFLPGTDIALTESEARQLGTLMTQAEQNNQPEIKQAIEAYFTQ
jgi:O-antigen ligase